MSVDEYKKIIDQMFKEFDESDNLFMNQIYTLVKKHLEKKGKR